MESTATPGNTAKKIHPLIAGAAVAVMLVCLTGVAAMTGLLPSSRGSTDTPADSLTAASPESQASAANQSNPAPVSQARQDSMPVPAKTSRSHSASTGAAPAVVAKSAAICSNCGRIESIETVRHEAKPSGVGVVAGAVLGGVLGNHVGGGNGRALATVAGAVGGGYAGNEVEKRSRATTSYQVRVRMEDGSIRSFPYAHEPGWSVGERVRVIDGHLTART